MTFTYEKAKAAQIEILTDLYEPALTVSVGLSRGAKAGDYRVVVSTWYDSEAKWLKAVLSIRHPDWDIEYQVTGPIHQGG